MVATLMDKGFDEVNVFLSGQLQIGTYKVCADWLDF